MVFQSFNTAGNSRPSVCTDDRSSLQPAAARIGYSPRAIDYCFTPNCSRSWMKPINRKATVAGAKSTYMISLLELRQCYRYADRVCHPTPFTSVNTLTLCSWCAKSKHSLQSLQIRESPHIGIPCLAHKALFLCRCALHLPREGKSLSSFAQIRTSPDASRTTPIASRLAPQPLSRFVRLDVVHP